VPLIDLGSRGTCLRRDALVAFGRRRVRTALSLGEAVSPWPNVLVDATRVAEPLTYLTAAWLAVGPDALVSGPSAAYLHGLTALPATPVHLVVPYEHRKRARNASSSTTPAGSTTIATNVTDCLSSTWSGLSSTCCARRGRRKRWPSWTKLSPGCPSRTARPFVDAFGSACKNDPTRVAPGSAPGSSTSPPDVPSHRPRAG